MPLDVLISAPVASAPTAAPGTKVAPTKDAVVAVDNLTEQKRLGADMDEAVRAAAKQIESFLRSMGRALEFRVDSDSGRTVVTVRNSATGDVIRQIPSEEALELARHLDQHRGALVNVAV